jgi:NOL1/NOP2/sun family putative RNA methylase
MPEEQLAPVAWSDDGLYCPAGLLPGRLALHAAGLYYIQEPSAMLPAMVLDARPGENVLDLCAAPGGKACKIAASLRGRGVLWANEVSPDRAKALLHNLEQTGCTNSIITRETPGRLADAMPAFFDKILVDAPCSGQGMFRRDPSAIGSFLAYGSSHCAGLQREILGSAWRLLRPGGTLVYSTCTFSITENEEMVRWMLDHCKDCKIKPIVKSGGVSDGFPVIPEMTGTARIWPHLANGEGHFCAMMEKSPDMAGGFGGQTAGDGPAEILNPAGNQAFEAFGRFCADHLAPEGQKKINMWLAGGKPRLEKQNLHIVPGGLPLPRQLAKIKTGLYLGQVSLIRDGRAVFMPSQSFLLSLSDGDFRAQAAGSEGSDLIVRYLRGETVRCPDEMQADAGRFSAVMLEGLPGREGLRRSWPLGWAKIQEGRLMKNLYPKAWRFLA